MTSIADAGLQRGQIWLQDLLKLAHLPATVSIEQHDLAQASGSIWLTIAEDHLTPEQVKILIGEHGEVLDALQYLANTIVNLGQPPEEQHAYTIELHGYRVKRQAELQALAEAAIAHVRATGQPYVIEHLSAAERRHIHNLLSGYDDLETFSQGREPARHLVVQPKSAPREAGA